MSFPVKLGLHIGFIQGWPCPFASSPLAIENSTWLLRRSASDEFSREHTNQLSTHAPAGVARKHYKALRLTAVKMMFTHDLPCISRLARAWASKLLQNLVYNQEMTYFSIF